MSIKALKDLQQLAQVTSKAKSNPYELCYHNVEFKIKHNKEPKMDEMRKWFIYKMETYYNSKMLGANVHYCYKTFNSIKDKYELSNLELCKKINVWHERYTKTNQDNMFDFSTLNTNWLIEKLDKDTMKGKVTYQNTNVNNIDTKDRWI